MKCIQLVLGALFIFLSVGCGEEVRLESQYGSDGRAYEVFLNPDDHSGRVTAPISLNASLTWQIRSWEVWSLNAVTGVSEPVLEQYPAYVEAQEESGRYVTPVDFWVQYDGWTGPILLDEDEYIYLESGASFDFIVEGLPVENTYSLTFWAGLFRDD